MMESMVGSRVASIKGSMMESMMESRGGSIIGSMIESMGCMLFLTANR